MIGRLVGTATAAVFTGVVVTGIAALIASEFGDVEKGISWAQQTLSAYRSSPSSIDKDSPVRNADNITFFKSLPIEGTTHQVTTGISFASAEDLANGKTKSRWCYILYENGKLEKRISLGKQSGQSKPVYDDPTRLPESELKSLGLTATRLASLARSHCFLGGFDPRSSTKNQQSKAKPPPRVWNWERPYSPYKQKKQERNI